MQAYPFIPPLSTREVKELLRQIRVMRDDYPHLSDQELADEWAEQQQWLAGAGKPTPFAAWMDGGDWRRGFQRAADFAGRQTAKKQQAKAMRKRAKEYRQDREPATPRQQRFVKRLAETRNQPLPQPAEAMSKLAASREIERLLDMPTTPLTEPR